MAAVEGTPMKMKDDETSSLSSVVRNLFAAPKGIDLLDEEEYVSPYELGGKELEMEWAGKTNQDKETIAKEKSATAFQEARDLMVLDVMQEQKQVLDTYVAFFDDAVELQVLAT